MDTIAALKEDDVLVFDQVFYEYHEKVYQYILRKTRSEYIAEEATQLTFIKLWRYRASLSHEYSLFTQLFRIARTTMIDLIRRQQHADLKISRSGLREQSADTIWEGIVEKEMRSRIEIAVREMPEMRRKVFEMSRFKGMTYREIAEDLSLSVKTVEAHLTQAIKQLKKLLGTTLLALIFCFLK
ncbi:MAG TPA: sigma-70 family RNA polymerase sigma factor [Puia sp.]